MHRRTGHSISTPLCSLTQTHVLQGKALTASSRGIHSEFAAAAEVLFKLQYDPLDVKATQFDADYRHFCKTVMELERRTSAIISQVRAAIMQGFSGLTSVSVYALQAACLIMQCQQWLLAACAGTCHSLSFGQPVKIGT